MTVPSHEHRPPIDQVPATLTVKEGFVLGEIIIDGGKYLDIGGWGHDHKLALESLISLGLVSTVDNGTVTQRSATTKGQNWYRKARRV